MKATTTPYGNFKSRKAALEYIDRYHAVELILKYPLLAAKYPYDKWRDHFGNGTNHCTRHAIHNMMRHDLLGKVPGWI